MKLAYLDTSCLVAVALGEEGAADVAEHLRGYDFLAASNLLEAELRSVLAREQVEEDPSPLLEGIAWVHPDRALSSELQDVVRQGYVRGADLWHLACASFLRRKLSSLEFLTLDKTQDRVARALGFETPLG